MKKKDLALIAIVIFISVIISLIVSSLLFGSTKARQQPVEIVDPISANFLIPDSRYFNNQSFDPTKLITIGNTTNPNPFNGTTQ
ncbi:MAG TPA: hypothetical protein VNE40_04555 [Candidatus Dormibacteraeota bacterium]|nr:hypothetical protein [Candidatus Dormibacteraeota bacterium]